jgi:hypothetical protein
MSKNPNQSYFATHYRVYHQLSQLVQVGDLDGVRKFLDLHSDLPGPPLEPLGNSVATAFDYACLYGHSEIAALLHHKRPDDYSGYAHLWFGTVHRHHITNEWCPRPSTIAEILATLPARYEKARITSLTGSYSPAKSA